MTNKKPIVVRRVLVIDDAHDVADITVEMLRSMAGPVRSNPKSNRTLFISVFRSRPLPA